jgi:hypothetical protein
MQNRKIIFKSDSRYYFCDIRDGKLVKKVSVSKEAAELIIELSNSVSLIESAEREVNNVTQD